MYTTEGAPPYPPRLALGPLLPLAAGQELLPRGDLLGQQQVEQFDQ